MFYSNLRSLSIRAATVHIKPLEFLVPSIIKFKHGASCLLHFFIVSFLFYIKILSTLLSFDSIVEKKFSILFFFIDEKKADVLKYQTSASIK